MTDDHKQLAQEIVEIMKREVPSQHTHHVEAFEAAIAQGLMRAAYVEADELRRKQDWHPSKKLQDLIHFLQGVF